MVVIYPPIYCSEYCGDEIGKEQIQLPYQRSNFKFYIARTSGV